MAMKRPQYVLHIRVVLVLFVTLLFRSERPVAMTVRPMSEPDVAPSNADPFDGDAQTMAAIRAMLKEDVADEPREGLGDKMRGAAAKLKTPKVKAAFTAPAEPEAAPKNAIQKTPLSARLRDKLPQRLRPVHVMLALSLLAVFLRPMWVFMIVCVTVLAGIGIAKLFGGDRIWGLLLARFNRMAERHPKRAKRIAARVDRAADVWDAILDRFPDGMVDGLYLPDFQALRSGDDRHAAAMDARLADMHRAG